MGFEHIFLSTAQDADMGLQMMAAAIQMIPLLLGFGILLLVLSIPKKIKRAKLRKAIKNIAIGDIVTTYSGMIGTVVARRAETVEIEMTEQSRIRFAEWGVAKVEKGEIFD